MSRGYPSDWDSRRREVYKRDGYTCQNCGSQGGRYGNTELHAHHIVPKSRGGSHSSSNLVTICKPCHNAVHYDHQAPTSAQQQTSLPTQSNPKNKGVDVAKSGDKNIKRALNRFGRTCIDAADFVEKIEGKDIAILSDGTLEDKELENKRVELIQRLGSIDLLLDSFDEDYEVIEAMKSYTNTLISLFTTFETVGEVIEDDSLTASEKRQIIEPKISKKLEEVKQESRSTKRSIDKFDRQVNGAQKEVEAKQKSSSFLSRLFNF